MTSSLAVISIDAVNPGMVAEFLCAVLGWVVLEEDDDGVSIGSPDATSPTIDLFRVPDTKCYRGTMVTPSGQKPPPLTSVERVQLGVRMESSLVKVLKGLAEFQNISLGQLLEKIVLHSFEPVPGQEGEACASPHGKKALAAIADLSRVYGMTWSVHDSRTFPADSVVE